MEMKLPEIPKSWLMVLLLMGALWLKSYGIDSYVTIILISIMSYILGRDIQKISNISNS